MPKENNLDYLNRGLVRLQEGGAPNKKFIEESWLDQGVKKRHLSPGSGIVENLVKFGCRVEHLKSNLYIIEGYNLVGTIIKMVRDRGNIDSSMMDMLRLIAMILEVVEIMQRRVMHLEDVSDNEEATSNPTHEPDVEQDEERILRFMSRVNSRPNIEFSCYDRRLEMNFVLDWITKMDK